MFIELKDGRWINSAELFRITLAPQLPAVFGYAPDGQETIKGNATDDAVPVITALVMAPLPWVKIKKGEFINVQKLSFVRWEEIMNNEGKPTGGRKLCCYIGNVCVLDARQDEATTAIIDAIGLVNTNNNVDRIG